MAIIKPTERIRFGGANALFTWASLGAGDQGEPVEFSEFADRSVQFSGVFGGGAASLEGSNDGENWHVLTDTAGAPITKTSGAISAVTEMTRFVRPVVAGGSSGGGSGGGPGPGPGGGFGGGSGGVKCTLFVLGGI